ncbi:Fis family transcriptional regulator [Sinomonas sp. G460-2]|uniref:Fis family transcriptional regulator n=1 Tax=Sinomonas sp. G460-2 TaxID=3393464 RepID=UPI0039F061D4
MSRPRKAEDPARWPVPCSRCDQHHKTVANWPDGGVCGYCYQQAKRIRGTCACGHEGVLPGLIDGAPACRGCSGVRLNVDCKSCGAEDELHSGGRCWSCVLGDTVDSLLADPSRGTVTPELVPHAAALKSMKRANSGLTWIRQEHVTAFLRQLAVVPSVTHDAVDELPSSPTREYVRGLLVEHGVIPRRDELNALYGEWAKQALDRVDDPANRDLVRRYVRWHHQRRMNQMDEVSRGTFLRSKQTVTVAIDFLNWLTARGVALAELQQGDLDAWQAEGSTTRGIADRFLKWAIKTNAAPSGLKMVPHRRGTSPRLSASAQDEAVQQVVHTDQLTPRDRAAAILVIVFGQQIDDVATLTWDDVAVSDELVTVRLGTIEIALPDPLDVPWRQLASEPGHGLTAAHPNSNWVFRGTSPGRHIYPGHLRQRLRTVFSTRAARLGTLHELTKLAPVPIIAETLGYAPATIERHAIDSAAAYAEYVAAVRT